MEHLNHSITLRGLKFLSHNHYHGSKMRNSYTVVEKSERNRFGKFRNR
jgi:hypothetical protein